LYFSVAERSVGAYPLPPKIKPAVCVPVPVALNLPLFKVPAADQLVPSYFSESLRIKG
jgi:hypothetical protein